MVRRSSLITSVVVLGCVALCVVALARETVLPPKSGGTSLEPTLPTIDLHQRMASLRVEQGQILTPTQAGPQRLSPEEFARALEASQGEASRRPLLMKLANVTGVGGFFWVAFGLLGQFIFMGRMVVQWLVSERNRRSVVPVAFWWMSLCGGTMLLIYFLWRRDPVGILGQMMGWLIYVRNLWLIYRPRGSSERAAPTDVAAG